MKQLRRLPGFLRTMARVRRRTNDQPRFLTYTVTYTCNARCIMCDSWKIPSPNDLTLTEIEGIFRQLPQMDAVRLTGGEPFVRKDLGEIAKLTQDILKPIFLHITTNGFLTSRIVEFCEQRDKSTPLQVLISIDGPEEKHNHVRGRDTAYKTAMATLQQLAPRRKELNLSVGVNQTIVDADGVKHYRELHELLRPLNVAHNMIMAYDVSATYSIERDKDVAPTEAGQFLTFGEFSKESIGELLDAATADLRELPFIERVAKRYYIKGIRNRLMGEIASPNPPCVAATQHLRIFPNGDVPTCQFNSKTLGNLREQSFADLWTSKRAEAQRDWVRKCPGCWAECEVLPSAIYSGDLLLN